MSLRLREEHSDADIDRRSGTDSTDRDRPHRIRCPKCAWQPTSSDRWQCRCDHVWNTFDTRGKCPACGFQWKVTECRRCHEISPHEDWYERRRD